MALNTIDLPPAKRPIETTFVCDVTVPAGECGFTNSIAHLSASEDRVIVDYEDLPPVMVQAVLAAEDRNFFDHSGIDPVGIGRAFYQSVLGSSASQQGGSTITQQYVKLTYLTSERSLSRKLKEAVLAVKLEGELDKRDILTRYLNEIYFGRGAYGVEAAARAYFGISAEHLQLHQAAYLAGLIRAPERADATRNPEEATRRRRTVLAGMVAEGYITPEQRDAADAVPWVEPGAGGEGTATMTVLPRQRSDPAPLPRAGLRVLGGAGPRTAARALRPGAETQGLRAPTRRSTRDAAAGLRVADEHVGRARRAGGALSPSTRTAARAMVGGHRLRGESTWPRPRRRGSPAARLDVQAVRARRAHRGGY